MKVGTRIARVKQVSFPEGVEKVFPEIELPKRFPGHVLCPLPGHPEKTPSCYFKETGWYCFGCHEGGDLIDLIKGRNEVSLKVALGIAEKALGFKERAGDLEELLGALAIETTAPGPHGEFRSRVVGLERWFHEFVVDYLRSQDPVVSGIAWSRASYVYRVLDYPGAPPVTTRGLRDRIRRLERFVSGWAWGIVRDVERVTGKDRLDVALEREFSGHSAIAVL